MHINKMSYRTEISMKIKIPHFRWYLKKIARSSIILGSNILRLFYNGPSRKALRVLTYHRFGRRAHDPFSIDINLFYNQMKLIKNNYNSVTYLDLIEYLRGNEQITKNSVLVTIDDGDISLYEYALPILFELEIPAIVFVSPGQIKDSAGTCIKSKQDRKISWKELVEMSDAGITVGSHGMHHRSLAQIPPFEAREEAYRSRRLLEDFLGHSISAFAYPYGTRRDYNNTTTEMLKNSGYTCAFTAVHGACLPCDDYFSLPRLQIEDGDHINLFKSIAEGRLDSLRIVDNYLWRLKSKPH